VVFGILRVFGDLVVFLGAFGDFGISCVFRGVWGWYNTVFWVFCSV